MRSVSSLRGARVLVTGGAGFIGSHLVDRLAGSGVDRICVVDDLFLGRPENIAGPLRDGVAELLTIDATSIRGMRDALRRSSPSVVFSLATIPLPASLERPRWAADAIVRMATVLAELARMGEFGTLVHVSSSEVYGSAVSVPMDESHPLGARTPYAAAKAAADLVIGSYWRTFSIDAVIVRPFNTYGPRQNDRSYAGLVPLTIEAIRAGRSPTVHGDGHQTRDYSFVTDIADGIVRAYLVPEARRRVINLGSGREVSVNEVVRRICELMDARVPPRHDEARPGDVRRHCADTSVAAELLGFRPQVGIDEGLRRTVQWYVGRAENETV